MNENIIKNLYDFWKIIGKSINKLDTNDKYSMIFLNDSDWPNRIFDVDKEINVIKEFKHNFENNTVLPPNLTLDYKIDNNKPYFLHQVNMAIDLRSAKKRYKRCEFIEEVKSQTDAQTFASVASKAFGYTVDPTIIATIKNLDEIKLFLYSKEGKSYGCGIIYFDQNMNSGLHMIGTVPEGRGLGIGSKMTEFLLAVSTTEKVNFCVLHASKMGERIYRRIGFESYGNLYTYKIKRIID